MKVDLDLQVDDEERVRVVDLEIDEDNNMYCTLEDGRVYTFYNATFSHVHEDFSAAVGIEVQTLETLYLPSKEPE